MSRVGAIGTLIPGWGVQTGLSSSEDNLAISPRILGAPDLHLGIYTTANLTHMHTYIESKMFIAALCNKNVGTT